MLLTIWLAAAMVQLAAIPTQLLIPSPVRPIGSSVTAQADISGYYVLAKMVSPSTFRIGKLTLVWNRSGTPEKPRDDLTINLEGLIYTGFVICPSKGTLLQVDLVEGGANLGTQNIGGKAGAAAVRIDWDCTNPVTLGVYSPLDSVRTWQPDSFRLFTPTTSTTKISFFYPSSVVREMRENVGNFSGFLPKFSGLSYPFLTVPNVFLNNLDLSNFKAEKTLSAFDALAHHQMLFRYGFSGEL